MSGRWNDLGGGGDSSQDFTQATQEEPGLGKLLVGEWHRSAVVVSKRQNLQPCRHHVCASEREENSWSLAVWSFFAG